MTRTTMKKPILTTELSLKDRVQSLGLHGILSEWERHSEEPWLRNLVEIEERTKKQRSLERRIQSSKIGSFKEITDFDWDWPRSIDKDLIRELFTFRFIEEAANAIFVGPNGVGKTMLVQNLAYKALLKGFTVRMTTASEMLCDLASRDGAQSYRRRLSHYCRPQLLVIDEVGYLSHDTRHADLLFEVVTRRYEQKSIVITANKPFAEWNDTFPHAACTVTLIDRLVHKSELVEVDGESYRLKEAKERRQERAQERKKKKAAKKPS